MINMIEREIKSLTDCTQANNIPSSLFPRTISVTTWLYSKNYVKVLHFIKCYVSLKFSSKKELINIRGRTEKWGRTFSSMFFTEPQSNCTSLVYPDIKISTHQLIEKETFIIWLIFVFTITKFPSVDTYEKQNSNNFMKNLK